MKRILLILSLAYLVLSVFLGGFPLNLFLFDALFNAKIAILLFGAAVVYSQGGLQEVRAGAVLEAAGLACILAVAAFLMFEGLSRRAGYGPTIDEPLLVDPVMNMMRTGDLNYQVYEYGGVMVYMLLAIFVLFTARSMAAFQFSRFADIPENNYYVVGRYAVAGIGVATVAAVYFTARRFFGRLPAVFAALILALSWLSYSTAREIRLDVALTLFVLAAHFYFLRMMEEPAALDYFLAGVFCGLAVGTKYSAAPIFASLILAHVFARKERAILNWNLLLSLAAGCGAYLLFNFSVLLHLNLFLLRLPHAIYYNLSPEHWSSTSNRPLEYFRVLSTDGIGVVAMIPALWTLFQGAWSGNRKLLLLWCFPLLYLAVVGSYPAGFPRYVLPVMPNLAILAGEGMRQITDWIRSKRPSLPETLVATAGLILILALPAKDAVQYSLEMRHVLKPQDIVDWVNQNIPENAVIAADGTGPILPAEHHQVKTLAFHDFMLPRNYRDADYLCVTENLFHRIPADYEVMKEFPAQTRSLDRYVRIYRRRGIQ